MRRHRGFVQGGVDPHDLKHWHDVLEQPAGDARAETTTRESLGLDQHVVVGYSASLTEDLGAARCDLFVLCSISVEEREKT